MKTLLYFCLYALLDACAEGAIRAAAWTIRAAAWARARADRATLASFAANRKLRDL